MPTSGCRKPLEQKVLGYFWPSMAIMLPEAPAAILNVIPVLTLAGAGSVSVVEHQLIVCRRLTYVALQWLERSYARAMILTCPLTASVGANGRSRGFDALYDFLRNRSIALNLMTVQPEADQPKAETGASLIRHRMIENRGV
jgi:hypothetical protein